VKRRPGKTRIVPCGRRFPASGVEVDRASAYAVSTHLSTVTPQARHGRPGRLGFRRGLLLAGLRRGPRDLPVAGGDREPHEIGEPLVDQGHLAAVPGHHRGPHLHGPRRLAALLQRHGVRGDEEVPVLPVRDPQDGDYRPHPGSSTDANRLNL
jgi:hypothetical protein